MSFRKMTLSFVAGLMLCSFGCAEQTERTARDGSLELTLSALSQGETANGSVSIRGMDRLLTARVASPSAVGEVTRVQLPAGLYQVTWQSNFDADREPPVVESAAQVVVVAAGGVSSLRLRSVPGEQHEDGVARLHDNGVEGPRVALR